MPMLSSDIPLISQPVRGFSIPVPPAGIELSDIVKFSTQGVEDLHSFWISGMLYHKNPPLDFWRRFFVDANPEILHHQIKAFAFAYHYYYKTLGRYAIEDLKNLAGAAGHSYDPLINFAGYIRMVQLREVPFWTATANDENSPKRDFAFFWQSLWTFGKVLSDRNMFKNWSIHESPWSNTEFVIHFVRACQSLSDNCALYEEVLQALGHELYDEFSSASIGYKEIQRLFEIRPALLKRAVQCFNPSELSERSLSALRNLPLEEYYARRQFGLTQVIRSMNGFPPQYAELSYLSYHKVNTP